MFAEVSRSLRFIPFELVLVFIQADSLLPCYTHCTRPVRPGREAIAAGHAVYRSLSNRPLQVPVHIGPEALLGLGKAVQRHLHFDRL